MTFTAGLMAACLWGCEGRSVGNARPDSSGGVDSGADADSLKDGSPPDAGPEVFCPLGFPDTASVTGTTPLGGFTGEVSAYGILGGECAGFRIVVASTIEELRRIIDTSPYEPTDGLWLFPETWNPETWSWVGEGTIRISHAVDGDEVQAEGVTEITRADKPKEPLDEEDPPRVEGIFSIDQGEWRLSGRIDATYCEALSIYCP